MSHFVKMSKASLNKPFSGKEKEQLEELRKTAVPRYVFRAFSNDSGGGPEHCTNTVDEIIPHGFMHGRQGHRFYEMSKADIKAMTYAHFLTDEEIVSEFSSWSASLLMVLCYAKYLENLGEEGIHVAVIDVHQLADDVLVWQVPHLDDEWKRNASVHEFMAHGCIRGPGYKAVPFEHIKEEEVERLFPELLELDEDDMFAEKIRQQMFERDPPYDLSFTQKGIIRDIGILFEPLDMPVTTALACARPRPWVSFNNERFDARAQTPSRYALRSLQRDALRYNRIFADKADVSTAEWLARGSVVTGPTPDGDDFPDERQWIDLLRAMAVLKEQPLVSNIGKRKRDENEDKENLDDWRVERSKNSLY
ncbi:glycoside hydrolase clan gh-d [Pyrenophora seminiperda CCB06]|uniref:Glycoside hydrolase clan gh-d n=1 Tax=Pyrenophora seminiperda CCB06 TaxID=1302712 RepID=A0A3M7MGR4_9PLEO|nr:glycoside hydrolase clan gh-d [Pyrenophora seminiperda CCB06]